MGILDVKEFMMRVPRRVLDFWVAFDRIEPIGEEWLQNSILGHELSRLRSTIYAVNGTEVVPQPFEDYMPIRWTGRDKKNKPKQAKTGLSMNALRGKIESRLEKGRG